MDCHAHHSNRGFTLLEVLVAIIVISIGLLGVARLQLTGMQYVTDSQLRTQASLLSQGIVDKIYANSADLTVYSDIHCDSAGDCKQSGTSITATQNCNTADCDNSQLAAVDVTNWLSEIAASLPAGQGWICRGAINNFTCGNNLTRDDWTVTVFWDEARDGRTGRNCDPNDSDDLQCYRLKFVPSI